MIIDLGGIAPIVLSFGVFVLLCWIGVKGFKENTAMHDRAHGKKSSSTPSTGGSSASSPTSDSSEAK